MITPPSPAQVQQLLKTFRRVELNTVSEQSGVPFQTLAKIRCGATRDPGLHTICRIFKAQVIQKRIESSPHIFEGAGEPVADVHASAFCSLPIPLIGEVTHV